MSNYTSGGFAYQLDKLLGGFKDSDIEKEAGDIALKICRKDRKSIKQLSASLIKESPSKGTNKPYISYFVAKPISDEMGKYGAELWNRKYQLSHLIEDPHALNFGGRTHNNYEMWKTTEKEMVKEFESEIDKLIEKKMKG